MHSISTFVTIVNLVVNSIAFSNEQYRTCWVEACAATHAVMNTAKDWRSITPQENWGPAPEVVQVQGLTLALMTRHKTYCKNVEQRLRAI
jgi:hypothetical protein